MTLVTLSDSDISASHPRGFYLLAQNMGKTLVADAAEEPSARPGPAGWSEPASLFLSGTGVALDGLWDPSQPNHSMVFHSPFLLVG